MNSASGQAARPQVVGREEDASAARWTGTAGPGTPSAGRARRRRRRPPGPGRAARRWPDGGPRRHDQPTRAPSGRRPTVDPHVAGSRPDDVDEDDQQGQRRRRQRTARWRATRSIGHRRRPARAVAAPSTAFRTLSTGGLDEVQHEGREEADRSVSTTSGASVMTSTAVHVGQVVAEALEEVAELAEDDALEHQQQVDRAEDHRPGRRRPRQPASRRTRPGAPGTRPRSRPGRAGRAGQHEEAEERGVDRRARRRGRPSRRWSGRGCARR